MRPLNNCYLLFFWSTTVARCVNKKKRREKSLRNFSGFQILYNFDLLSWKLKQGAMLHTSEAVIALLCHAIIRQFWGTKKKKIEIQLTKTLTAEGSSVNSTKNKCLTIIVRRGHSYKYPKRMFIHISNYLSRLKHTLRSIQIVLTMNEECRYNDCIMLISEFL